MALAESNIDLKNSSGFELEERVSADIKDEIVEEFVDAQTLSADEQSSKRNDSWRRNGRGRDHLALVSFVPKKNKAVILASSMDFSLDIDHESSKREIIMTYNSTKIK
ncbi:hypothetical protein QYM36_016317 [Artemia franciscana]|uniref:Uncharacterized protein n=1 Tax=Artemia franciscana TaxID=6661 RepID=A0AA88HBZ4_ARTSF|nr:hypothetical protein QYM36_016317 [Artemia franciscana]